MVRIKGGSSRWDSRQASVHKRDCEKVQANNVSVFNVLQLELMFNTNSLKDLYIDCLMLVSFGDLVTTK